MVYALDHGRVLVVPLVNLKGHSVGVTARAVRVHEGATRPERRVGLEPCDKGIEALVRPPTPMPKWCKVGREIIFKNQGKRISGVERGLDCPAVGEQDGQG